MARKKATKRKYKLRIPGVSVGQVVGTSLGPMKKVYFKIGGKTFFRMVDPDPGRPRLVGPSKGVGECLQGKSRRSSEAGKAKK